MIFTMKKKEYNEVLDDLFEDRKRSHIDNFYDDCARIEDELSFDQIPTGVREAYLEASGAI